MKSECCNKDGYGLAFPKPFRKRSLLSKGHNLETAFKFFYITAASIFIEEERVSHVNVGKFVSNKVPISGKCDKPTIRCNCPSSEL